MPRVAKNGALVPKIDEAFATNCERPQIPVVLFQSFEKCFFLDATFQCRYLRPCQQRTMAFHLTIHTHFGLVQRPILRAFLEKALPAVSEGVASTTSFCFTLTGTCGPIALGTAYFPRVRFYRIKTQNLPVKMASHERV